MSDVSIRRPGDVAGGLALLRSPLAVLVLVCAVLVVLLTLPLRLPIGAMYWDLFVYFDAANRIFDGQTPGLDFFAPVGPLGYWLFAGGLALFPDAQPLLLVDWSILVVTAPLMALVIADVDRRSRGLAFALLAPFLVFSILPFNVESFSSYPGVDGFGIYNRQTSRLLFVLVAALVFSDRPRRLGFIVTGAMTALFLTKITGFLAGGLLCLFAVAAGRFPLRTAVLSAVVFVGFLGLLQAALGVVDAYLGGVAVLIGMNEGSLLPRFLQAASIHLGVLAPASLLVAVLGIVSAPAIRLSAKALATTPSFAQVARVLDRDVFWLAVALLAGFFFETQNTGGHAFLLLWPVLLRLLVRAGALKRGQFAVVLTLVATTSLPTATTVLAKAGRAAVGQLRYERLESRNLKTLGAVTQRSEFMRRAKTMLATYAAFPAVYETLATKDELPSLTLFADPDYQIALLQTTDEAVDAVKAYEAAHAIRFETIMNLGFVNPFPWLLDRHATRFIAIGADPFRAVPAPTAEVAAAVRATDLVLYSTCPVTSANTALLALYRPFLSGHERVELSRCWEAYVRGDLIPRR